MDGVSVAASAVSIGAACLKLSTLLYQWIEETRGSDETIKTLANELKTLSTILDVVKTCSQSRPGNPKSVAEHEQDLWRLVQRTVDDCGTTTEKLEKILGGISHRKGIGLTITNFQLTIHSEKMSRLREHLQTNKGVLQITLQTISVYESPPGLLLDSHNYC